MRNTQCEFVQLDFTQKMHCESPRRSPTHQPMLDPARTVLARFGGAGPLSRLLGLDRSAVHRWALPKARGGTGGLLPAKHHQRLLALAIAEGVVLSAADLIGVPDAEKGQAGHGADDG